MNAAVFTRWVRERLSFEGLFLLILLVTIALRFYFLDLKLFHHDEAIHAWFSYKLLTEGTYIYDPMYHGPFLYYTTAGIFSLLGDSDLVGRLLPALFGTLLVALVYPVYKLGYLDKKQALIAALFLAVSPNMVYFSRFLRNDIYIAFFTMALLVALLYYIERGQMRYALLAGAAAGFGMSAKENMPIVLLIFGAFFLYLVWTRKVRLPARWVRDVVLGGLVLVGIMAVFYSSFGAHPEVLLDGWLRAIEHWTSMHQMQRLGGPPYYYILLFILYEIPILALAVVGVLQFFDVPGAVKGLWRRRREGATAEAPVEGTQADVETATVEEVPPVEAVPVVEEIPAVEEAPPVAEIPPAPETRGLRDRLRGLFGRGGEAGPVNRQEEFARFAIFWMLLSLAAYAYIGEKVPWLILHQLLPMVFVAVYAMTTRKAVIAVLASIFLVAMTFHVAFTPADINEPIVQVQNSEDLRDVFAKIDAADRVAVASESYWPLPWYYRGEGASKLSYYSKKVGEPTIYAGDFDLVITQDSDTYPSLEGYEKETRRLNYWFSYTENKDRLLEYYFLRDGKVGSRNLEVFSRVPATG
ncbi:glycosyl transferase family protein [Methanoculleus bourgensis MS2]|uniref:Glycosyl transferase family protein n=2 Tax=Methanoculleus bourgensis TaxID=83986 RepID=I7J8B6_METBM|nr:flippase activity-associated protein Agl23 [Methanoculleus bourgensis]CCJ35983.1 glycosyl transferase family protein [Methanoculleus bourgensis MS2]